MVYDCIPFFNELDILNLRLHILSPYVDRFVIEEATTTFSGQPKELCFEKNKELFREFLPKITYIVVDDDLSDAESTHARDVWQKNHLIKGLQDAKPNDVVIFGDCDEIPNPEALQSILENFDPGKVYHLAQRNFYAFLNMEEQSGSLLSVTGDFPKIPDAQRKWLGTKVTSFSLIPEEGIDRLRDLVPVNDPRSVRAGNGGWHFGYMGGHHETNAAKRIGVKVRAAAHQEYNDKEILAETMDHLRLGHDIFGRNARFIRVEIDESYPQYLREHISDYDYLIMPPITALTRFTSRFDLTVGRFCRKAWRHVLRRFRR